MIGIKTEAFVRMDSPAFHTSSIVSLVSSSTELCEVREVPNVELIHRTAITSGNKCEEGSLCSLGGLVTRGKAHSRNTGGRGSRISHGELFCVVFKIMD